MKKDTITFLSTVIGIPLLLSGAWGVNAMNEASTVVYKREYTEEATPQIPVPVETPKEKATAPTTPTKKPVAVKPTPEPAVVPVSVTVPAAVVTSPPVEPAPKPVVVKKSRRTRAS